MTQLYTKVALQTDETLVIDLTKHLFAKLTQDADDITELLGDDLLTRGRMLIDASVILYVQGVQSIVAASAADCGGITPGMLAEIRKHMLGRWKKNCDSTLAEAIRIAKL